MKPTTEQIIELAREAGFNASNGFSQLIARHGNGSWVDISEELTRFAALLLERFGAGGGEPVGEILNYVGDVDWISYVPLPKTKLYTQPSPTDLRAEYLRGLEDGFKEGWIECSKWAQRDDLIADIGSPSYEACVSAVKALKGKQ